jgi:hypothetical protein
MSLFFNSTLYNADGKIRQAELVAQLLTNFDGNNLVVGMDVFSLDVIGQNIYNIYNKEVKKNFIRHDNKKFCKVLQFICHDNSYNKAIIMREIIVDNLLNNNQACDETLKKEAILTEVISLPDYINSHILQNEEIANYFIALINDVANLIMQKSDYAMCNILKIAVDFCEKFFGINLQDEMQSIMKIDGLKSKIDCLDLETYYEIIKELEIYANNFQNNSSLRIVNLNSYNKDCLEINKDWENIIITDCQNKAYNNFVALDANSVNALSFNQNNNDYVILDIYKAMKRSKNIIFICSALTSNLDDNYGKLVTYLNFKLHKKPKQYKDNKDDKKYVFYDNSQAVKSDIVFPSAISVLDLELLLTNPYIFYIKKVLKLKSRKPIFQASKSNLSLKRATVSLFNDQLSKNNKLLTLKTFLNDEGVSYLDLISANEISRNLFAKFKECSKEGNIEINKSVDALIESTKIYGSVDTVVNRENNLTLYFHGYKSNATFMNQNKDKNISYSTAILNSMLWNLSHQSNDLFGQKIHDVMYMPLQKNGSYKKLSTTKRQKDKTIQSGLSEIEKNVKDKLHNYRHNKMYQDSGLFEKYQHTYAHLARRLFIYR